MPMGLSFSLNTMQKLILYQTGAVFSFFFAYTAHWWIFIYETAWWGKSYLESITWNNNNMILFAVFLLATVLTIFCQSMVWNTLMENLGLDLKPRQRAARKRTQKPSKKTKKDKPEKPDKKEQLPFY